MWRGWPGGELCGGGRAPLAGKSGGAGAAARSAAGRGAGAVCFRAAYVQRMPRNPTPRPAMCRAWCRAWAGLTRDVGPAAAVQPLLRRRNRHSAVQLPTRAARAAALGACASALLPAPGPPAGSCGRKEAFVWSTTLLPPPIGSAAPATVQTRAPGRGPARAPGAAAAPRPGPPAADPPRPNPEGTPLSSGRGGGYRWLAPAIRRRPRRSIEGGHTQGSASTCITPVDS